ncbi:MAG: molecular chaperone HtpG [Nitrospirae bacterium GWC2_42_7]|nr:MAG: molecular chaperone HtpG [Nitrospirae bacterium GWC2_42_7]HBO84472.1 molecular chaperone HtpG [Deltaproteobacteria bacterium]
MTVQTMEFKTEIKQLLDLMIHSLYSHKEIFLRELISNASDAIDKARYESLTNKDIIVKSGPWKIKIKADKEKGIITLSDNGIGMTKDELVEALGTIAHSGTKEFLKSVQSKDIKDAPELIGQFGVGFYSSFMVADKVIVLTRQAGIPGNSGTKWESTADGSFTINEIEKETPGTDIILHIKEEEKKYLDEWELRDIIRKYSDYIEYPVVMDVEREQESAIEKGKKVKVTEEETLNSQKAIWLKDKTEITENEYNEFYKHVSHDFHDPLKVIHYKAEGTSEFTCLFYLPAKAPMDMFYKDFKIGLMLYVKRVQIMDHCEQLLPLYLRFIKGVVDSSDLPLNVSREILQSNRQVEIIKKNITKKVLDTLADMKKNDSEQYLLFFREFGKVLKEGIHYDFSKKETIAELLLFNSTKSVEGGLRTLQEYLDGMKPEQDAIYYITAPSLNEAIGSPYLEVLRDKDYEVLIMTDEVDDFIFNHFEYKGKKMRSATRGEVAIDSGNKEEAKKQYAKLIDVIKAELKDDVKDVRLSGRLKDSPCCLVSDEGDLDPNMEKLLKAMGQEVSSKKRILEINPSHDLFGILNSVFEHDNESATLKEYISLLYDQALLLEGSKPKNPLLFTQYVSKLMIDHAKREQIT